MQTLTKTRRRAISEPKEPMCTTVDLGLWDREAGKLPRFYDDLLAPAGRGGILRRVEL